MSQSTSRVLAFPENGNVLGHPGLDTDYFRLGMQTQKARIKENKAHFTPWLGKVRRRILLREWFIVRMDVWPVVNLSQTEEIRRFSLFAAAATSTDECCPLDIAGWG
ncbi:predicted protein [Coccidioides posadasii str. Silveira]|uniref:Predicted protein n=2 Tax=Coccidioides posadasii TaxID=199306 RepID=E9CUY6_COCPS|nr:predicted protein [Coccidioides posadasii str. Silveira]KMM71585.1 hypothetical protein CPAG_07888 [Coccidioides posadasii RMSCC 3488]